MTTLHTLINDLMKLHGQVHGDTPVDYRHGASGDCGPIGSPYITDEVNECGPFDIEDGEKYVSIYIGN